jgi:dipeptidyl aminopeptidase/acylaminoacyl peptidase
MQNTSSVMTRAPALLLALLCACGSRSASMPAPIAAIPPAGPAGVADHGLAAGGAAAGLGQPAWWSDTSRFRPMDVFELEWAEDPRISPDGTRVVYVRRFMDVMRDRRRAQIWMLNADGSAHRPIEASERDCSTPRWSPDGARLSYVCQHNSQAQIFVRWMDSGQTAVITRLVQGPSNVTWSPDGRQLAFTMLVPAEPRPMAQMPRAPQGAEWAPPPRVIDQVVYRVDGAGYLEPGFSHVFVVPADGGSPRQLTSGAFHHQGEPAWTPDGRHLIISANRRPDWELEPLDSELHEIDVATGAMRALTRRDGPDIAPAVSPDGRHIAYLGFDDTRQSYRINRLYVLERASGKVREHAAALDRSFGDAIWSADSRGVYVSYDDRGATRIALVPLSGAPGVLAGDLGGTSIDRPYGGGSFTVARTGAIAYTVAAPHRLADVAVLRGRGTPRRLTALNDDLLGHKRLGAVEEIWFESSHDRRRVQGWVVTPPDFDPGKKYPLLLEIHGGPFANYGPRFSADCQLYAAAGYVVLYVNPRGSSSYGEEFGNLIHHAYPGNDYDDLISGVDAVIARGYVDPARLYVTGGSGGGVLTSWIVGKTDRFRAAVVAKPVINWSSFVLTADFTNFFYRYWFPGPPWEHPEQYHARSPLSLVGNVTTPTMLLTGEHDYRTPISESEQLYQALKLRKVETVLVRIPGASHSIDARPSQLIAKALHVLAWFDRHGGQGDAAAPPAPGPPPEPQADPRPEPAPADATRPPGAGQ